MFCQGDSGGPLMFLNPYDNLVYLMRIAYTGDGCNRKNPSLRSKTTHFMEWTNENIHTN